MTNALTTAGSPISDTTAAMVSLNFGMRRLSATVA
jgi:hypothetical protein